MSDQHPAEGRLGPGHIRCVRGIPTSADTPQHSFWTTTRNLVMRFSLKTAYGIVAEPFRALNDLYTSGGDITHALSMSSSRALNAYHEASRAETVLSFETCVRKNDGPAHPSSYTAVSYAWVFQELRRAQCIELVCGENQMDWKDFEALFNGSIDLYRIFTPSMARKINTSTAARMERLRRKLVDPSIWNLLQETRHLACADMRDKVYAILSIATEGADGIEADYLKTLH